MLCLSLQYNVPGDSNNVVGDVIYNLTNGLLDCAI